MTESAGLLRTELVPLAEAFQRVAVRDLAATTPLPAGDLSLRDGFAIVPKENDAVKAEHIFRVVGEVPAGCNLGMQLSAGTACRIMTGGVVPSGASRVIPQEGCIAEPNQVRIPASAIEGKGTFIERRGSRIAEGDQIVAAGVILQPEHLALLATTGHTAIEVYQRPRVGFFCTGSELVESGEHLVPGAKVSANRHLFEGLIRHFLAEAENLGIVHDKNDDLELVFDKVASASLDMVISTGGMGPGKYDLLVDAFCRAGGQIVSRSLAMRPGTSILIGKLGKSTFYGLPGPPPAVRTLINELIGPALLRMQGVKDSAPVSLQAILQEDVEFIKTNMLYIKAGVLRFENGIAGVRLAKEAEVPTCFILFPSGRSVYRSGVEVEVHLVYSTSVANIFNP